MRLPFPTLNFPGYDTKQPGFVEATRVAANPDHCVHEDTEVLPRLAVAPGVSRPSNPAFLLAPWPARSVGTGIELWGSHMIYPDAMEMIRLCLACFKPCQDLKDVNTTAPPVTISRRITSRQRPSAEGRLGPPRCYGGSDAGEWVLGDETGGKKCRMRILAALCGCVPLILI